MEISLNNIELLNSYSCRQIKLTQDLLSSSQQGKVTEKELLGMISIPTLFLHMFIIKSFNLNAIDNFKLKITVPTDFIVKKFN